jgi:glyoxylase-like metal-dependent hydrolase (beta-lactamase superfamily II)
VSDYRAGLSRVAGGSYAWLQPDGGWGLSNSGLVLGDGEAVLIDTLFDLATSRRMLDGMDPILREAPIRTAINTHGNGDHWFGNQVLPGDTRIFAAEPTLADMQAVGPAAVAGLKAMPGPAGDFARRNFAAFDFTPVRPRYPTDTYRGELELSVAGLDLRLFDVGPAHTSGDTVVFCERDGVVFTGDIVFAGGTPIMWEGPVDNWIRACRRIKDLGARFLVPGHGPIVAPDRAQDMADYLEFVRAAAARRYDRGLTADEAARDIPLRGFAGWPEAERLAANVQTMYREFSSTHVPALSGPQMFGCMAQLQEYWLGPDGSKAQTPQPDSP